GGTDTLTGGGGSNTYVLAGATVTITDFDPDDGDTIVIYEADYEDAGGNYLLITSTDDDGNVVIEDMSGTVWITLEGYTDTSLDGITWHLNSDDYLDLSDYGV
ncbi:hypothetical protein, partial [Roseibium sp. RKSG952]|uniref:hypothetical protein n=1 Tax=Roseibium sp. RKSG952 TaxID=2529384 RepID=UPI001AD93CAB